MKLLIDTNIVIGLEDAKAIQDRFASLHRKCGENGVAIFVHEASKEDIARDKDPVRKEATLSKLKKFQTLKKTGTPNDAILASRFGELKKPNDVVDAKLLSALERNAVDLLVTEDDGLHRRAKAAGLGDRVLTVADALIWLKQTFEPDSVFLPSVESVKAYEFDFNDPIFNELRLDYAGFEKWAEKCAKNHRDCWIVRDGDSLAGVVIRKDETRAEAETVAAGDKVLKVCTFKVAEKYRGQKLGEQLLKQVLWHAQRNHYDSAYVSAYSKQTDLIRLLEDYGFSLTRTLANGEQVLEKALVRGTPILIDGEALIEAVHRIYPRFLDSAATRKFVVPIRPAYHAKLFPEAALGSEDTPTESTGRPGNTIKKVYLCNAPSGKMRPGDLVFFYVTKSNKAPSQCLTTLGVIESVRTTSDIEDVRRWTAKRSVFSDAELTNWVKEKKSIKIIDFLLVGHIEPAISLAQAIGKKVLVAHPQSIAQMSEKAYGRLKSLLPVGFDR